MFSHPYQKISGCDGLQRWIRFSRLWRGFRCKLLSDIEVSGEHDSLLHSIDVHNREVIALDSRWHQVEQQTAAEIDSLSGRGGLHDEIPMIRAGGLVAGVHDVSMSGSVNPVGGFSTLFQGAVTQMVEQGFRQSSQASVETASELYENATSRNVTGEDVTRLYHHLGQMTAGEIEKFATATPEVNRYSLPLPVNDEQLRAWPSGLDGARWWDGMDEPQRDAMLSFLPLLTGNTEGVPYRKRHDANMKVLNEVSKDNYLEEYKRTLIRFVNPSFLALARQAVRITHPIGF